MYESQTDVHFIQFRSHFPPKWETQGLKKQKAEQQSAGPKQLKIWWQKKCITLNVNKDEGYRESNLYTCVQFAL